MIGPTLSSLPGRLRERADVGPLLEDERGAVDAAAFESRVLATVGWLREQGIGPGDRVGVWLVNRIEWLALLFALARIGATLVAINTRYRSSELTYMLERSRARLLVMQLDFRGIDFPRVLAGVEASRVPDLERIAVVDAGSGPPATLLGRPAIAFDAFEREPVASRIEPDVNSRSLDLAQVYYVHRAEWTGSSWCLREPGTPGAGLKIVFDGSDLGTPYLHDASFTPVGLP